jgi:hypothetical protein
LPIMPECIWLLLQAPGGASCIGARQSDLASRSLSIASSVTGVGSVW